MNTSYKCHKCRVRFKGQSGNLNKYCSRKCKLAAAIRTKEHKKGVRQLWRKKNCDRHREYFRKRYLLIKVTTKYKHQSYAWQAAWRKNNPEKAKEIRRRSYAKHKAIRAKHNLDKWWRDTYTPALSSSARKMHELKKLLRQQIKEKKNA